MSMAMNMTSRQYTELHKVFVRYVHISLDCPLTTKPSKVAKTQILLK